MKRYLLKRITTGLLTVLIAIVLNFFLIHIAPGDPIRIMAGMDHPSSEQLEALYVRYGLDKPLLVQLGQYIVNLLHGDFGTSYTYNKPVVTLIWETMGPSILLALTSCVLAFALGTLLGLFAARHQGRWMDNLLSYVSYLFDSMPPFWLGLVAINALLQGVLQRRVRVPRHAADLRLLRADDRAGSRAPAQQRRILP